jgi:hypothetical protein
MFIYKYLFMYIYIHIHKRSSSVVIANRYRLASPEIESRWGRYFQTGTWAHAAFYAMGIGTFKGLLRPGTLHDRPPHIAPRLQKEDSYNSTPYLRFLGLLLCEV